MAAPPIDNRGQDLPPQRPSAAPLLTRVTTAKQIFESKSALYRMQRRCATPCSQEKSAKPLMGLALFL
jgi:hypothetical protein